MIEFESFAFAAPPRTGGAWFLQACQAIHLMPYGHGRFWMPDDGMAAKYSLSIVRHPLSWLRSIFASRPEMSDVSVEMRTIDLIRKEVDERFGSFVDFVFEITHHHPGIVGRAFGRYQASMCLRLEDFPWSPTEFFSSLGVPVDAIRHIVGIPQTHSTEYAAISDADYDSAVRMIGEAEFPTIQRYDYQ